MNVSVHVNRRYVDSSKPDLDAYDRETLRAAIQSLAWHINQWHSMGKPDRAQPYVAFKERIKKHLEGQRKWDM